MGGSRGASSSVGSRGRHLLQRRTQLQLVTMEAVLLAGKRASAHGL
jgi:hypothetical protein